MGFTLFPSFLALVNNENCYAMTFGGDYSGLCIFPSFIALVHENPSFVECTRYSRNISLIYIKV